MSQDPYQPYQPQPPYAAPYPVVIAQQVPASGMATASLVFGILGVLGGWCLLGIPCLAAVICGHIGMTQTADGSRSGRGMAVAGLVMGYVFALPTIVFFLMVIVGGAMAGTVAVTPTP